MLESFAVSSIAPIRRRFLERIFNRIDVEKSGHLSLEQLVAAAWHCVSTNGFQGLKSWEIESMKMLNITGHGKPLDMGMTFRRFLKGLGHPPKSDLTSNMQAIDDL